MKRGTTGAAGRRGAIGARGAAGRPGRPGAIGKQGAQGVKGRSGAVLQRESLDGIAAHFEGIYGQLTALAQRIARMEHQLHQPNANPKNGR
jgi:hypothetical protein